ncbi:MAG: hypothetical protein WBB67_06710 [bacterium]
METLDKIEEIISYALINAEDGSVDQEKSAGNAPVGDLTAFFSSASEVIRDSLSLGTIKCLSLCYGDNRLVIFPHESKYIGVEIARGKEPVEIIEKILSSLTIEEKPEIKLPRSLSSKVKQINLLIDEFGGSDKKAHWLELLKQGLDILGGDILPLVGIINEKLSFKDNPSMDKEDDFVQGLRSIIDFLVKKAVEEMGSSQARAKVQAVIERMK